MDNFDQLIKEKLENKTYSYKASAWKNFAHNSGVVAPVSGLKIAAISIAAVGILSTGGYFLYQGLQPETPTIVVDEIATDNNEMKEETFAAEDTMAIIQEIEEVPVAQVQPKAKPAITAKDADAPMGQIMEEPKKAEPILRERNDNWRVIMINVDTIGPED